MRRVVCDNKEIEVRFHVFEDVLFCADSSKYGVSRKPLAKLRIGVNGTYAIILLVNKGGENFYSLLYQLKK